MSADGQRQFQQSCRDTTRLAQSLCDCWQELCKRYLPVSGEGSIWSFSRAQAEGDPEQGWKLHVSANLLTACEVMRRVAPFLQSRQILFKAPSLLPTLAQINRGLGMSYSQVGKFITVYPQSDKEAVSLARRLHKLTLGISAPAVPFDTEFRTKSCVYYRYGGFKQLVIENPDGTRTRAIRNPDGDLVPDLFQGEKAELTWASNPFGSKRPPRHSRISDSPLRTTYRVFRALSQRGKGGVYQAIDLSVNPPRLCILKEGRRGGEMSWDGRDGNWRIRNEERVLNLLRAAGVNVPLIYSSFEVEGHYYLATEFIEGEDLHQLLIKRRKRLTVHQVLRYGIELSQIISAVHAAGWVWRDCKPGNLMVTKKGVLRPLDFEGACPVDGPDHLTWNTIEFSPPELRDLGPAQSSVSEDIYAIGATIYFLLTGRLLAASNPAHISELRRNVSSFLCDIVAELTASDPQKRPAAQAVIDSLGSAMSLVQESERLSRRSNSTNLGSERKPSRSGSIIKDGKVANLSLQASCNILNA
jgi:serine/threonine protein kinase